MVLFLTDKTIQTHCWTLKALKLWWLNLETGLHIDGLMQKRRNSSVLAELHLSGINPSIYTVNPIIEDTP